jgi:hypothetical protein
MKRKQSQGFAVVAGIVVLTAMMLFPFGCSKLLPTAPNQDAVQGFPAEELWPAPPADLVAWPLPCSAEDSKMFGRKGGELDVAAACFDLQFRVPPEALSEKALISVRATLFNYWKDGQLEKGLCFKFGPDGLVFAKPAYIEFEASALGARNGELLRLYYFNPQTGLWQVEQVAVVKDASVEIQFEVGHFSRYAIS